MLRIEIIIFVIAVQVLAAYIGTPKSPAHGWFMYTAFAVLDTALVVFWWKGWRGYRAGKTKEDR